MKHASFYDNYSILAMRSHETETIRNLKFVHANV
jgi:hypothetical protein